MCSGVRVDRFRALGLIYLNLLTYLNRGSTSTSLSVNSHKCNATSTTLAQTVYRLLIVIYFRTAPWVIQSRATMVASRRALEHYIGLQITIAHPV